MASIRFGIDYAKQSRSSCKKCKGKIETGGMRIAKLVPNPFSDNAGDMKQYYHATCIFDSFLKARAGTKIIESPEDLEGWTEVTDDDKDGILEKIQAVLDKKEGKATGKGTTPAKKKQSTLNSLLGLKSPPKKEPEEPKPSTSVSLDQMGIPEDKWINPDHVDNAWSTFTDLCTDISAHSAYNQKTAIVKQFLTSGKSEDDEFNGDIFLVVKLLLPGVIKRVYNINSTQLIKLFSKILRIDVNEMNDYLNKSGDVSETLKEFFTNSRRIKPQDDSSLTIYEVDLWLDQMTQYTTENDQLDHLESITKKCTPTDLMYVIRQLKHDLRINSGAKHILEAVDPNAYSAFQASHDLRTVIDRVQGGDGKISVDVQVGIPVHPMLAEACKSVEYAFKKCPNGIFSEIKYDGERVQVHKSGSKFHYYSRSLKPVQSHKISLFEKYIAEAFPGGDDLILDSEVLLVDTNTSKPLPFGSLGKHKKAAFKDAVPCLFIFDCILYNEDSLTKRPLVERRKILMENMKEIPNRIMFSEMTTITDRKHLKRMINQAIQEGLEGLVLKDKKSIYEPGKRHWLKVKKDYLKEGSMADSADLIVLGATYGTGNKGGLMSVYLMGCYDPRSKKFCTVTKCGNGHDDATLTRIDKELRPTMNEIGKDFSLIPSWLKISRTLVPDFIVLDPKKAPVWEIAGAEFSKSESHTANGISIRFPRVTRVRDDKSWDKATNLQELQHLYDTSKESADFLDSDSDTESKPDKKKLVSSAKPAGSPKKESPSPISESKKTPEIKKEPSPVSKQGSSGKPTGTPKKAPVTPIISPQRSLTRSLSQTKNTTPKVKEEPSSERKADIKKSPASASKTLLESAPDRRKPANDRKRVRKTSSSDSEEDRNDGGKPVSKKPARSNCKYGSLCYRKNPEHLREFAHPWRAANGHEENSDESSESDAIFKGLKFYLSEDLTNLKKLKRSICLFGGEVLRDFEAESATHVVLPQKGDEIESELEFNQKVVYTDLAWMEKCIKQEELVKPD